MTSGVGQLADALAPRVFGAMKAILGSLGQKATRQRLQRAAERSGYSEAEFEAALECLQQTTVEPQTADLQDKTVEAPGASNANAFDPHAAGAELVERLKLAEGGAWTGAELQRRFGLSAAVLHRRRKEHRILYWRDARHEFHYPQWQFTATGALLPGLQEVLQTFRSVDEWRLMSYFLNPRRQLDDRRPLDLLRGGEKDKVLSHATLHAKENTW